MTDKGKINSLFLKIWLPAILIFIVGTIILIIVGFIYDSGIGYLIWFILLIVSCIWVMRQKRKAYVNQAKADVSNTKGTMYIAQGRINDAIAEYSKAISISQNHSLSYYNRGNAYIHKGDLDSAINDFNKSIDINPTFTNAYHSRGNAYLLNNRKLDKAISDFNMAIQIDKNYSLAYYSRGSIYIDKEEWDKAILDFDKAIEINPTFANAYFNRAIAYHNTCRNDEAKNDLEKVLELSNDSRILQEAKESIDEYFTKSD